jgi:hypothetical protein
MSAIICQKCFMMSSNPNDVEQSYCGNCHAFVPGVVVNEPMDAINLPIRQEHFDALVAGRVVSIPVHSMGIYNPTTIVMLRLWGALKEAEAAMGREDDEHPARSPWREVKAGPATILLLAVCVGCPVLLYGLSLVPLWVVPALLVVYSPIAVWAWKGLRRDYKGS